MKAWLCALGLALSWVATSVSQERPAALEKMVAARDALRTGQMELSHTNYARPAGDGRVHTMLMGARFAGDRHVWVFRGDEEGVVTRTVEGAPSSVGGTAARFVFESPGEFWDRHNDALSHISVLRRGADICEDFRTLGVGPGRASVRIHDLVWRQNVRDPVAMSFEEWDEGDLHVVRARTDIQTTTYWLDPQRAWAPVRVRSDYSNGGWAEARSALKLSDGVWFPALVRMYSRQYKDGKEPAEVVEVLSATFNRPDHPQQLTVADIGVEPGMDVQVMDDKAAGNVTLGKWDGNQVLSFGEFAQRLSRGEVKEGPSFLAAVHKAQSAQAEQRKAESGGRAAPLPAAPPEAAHASTAPAEGLPRGDLTLERALDGARREAGQPSSLWEEYVQAFIKKYRLNEDQSQKAFGILRECQDAAQAYLSKRKPDIERLAQRRAALSAAPEKDRGAQRVDIEKEFRDLLKPVDEIFDKQLKPRLDKLPTRAQRAPAEAETKPTSQPKDKGQAKP